MKRLLAILLIALLLVSVGITGCNQTDNGDDSEVGAEVDEKDNEGDGSKSDGDGKSDDGKQTDASGDGEKAASKRKGGWLDQITMIGVNDDAAVTQLKAGAIDIFAGSLTGEALKQIQEAGLEYVGSSGTNYEIMLNNGDTMEKAGTFNPFSIKKVRQGLQRLIDRNYIVQEVFSGAAVPRYFPISSGSPDYARYVEFARKAEATMSYDKEKATQMITEAMEAAGAVKNGDGNWTYNGEVVTVKFLIRTEDGKRKPIGDYISNELESIGITVDRFYGTSAECGAICFQTDPFEGKWHLYTGAWGASTLARDSAIYVHDYDSPDSRMSFLLSQKTLEPSPEYNEILESLANNKFSTMEERSKLFEKAFAYSAEHSFRIWIADGRSYTPWNDDVATSYNLAAGVDGDTMTAYTIRFKDKEGGSMVWGNQSPPLIEPINPINGSNWAYDNQYVRMTQDYGKIGDPFTGLFYAKRAEKADVVVKKGLPVGVQYDWVDLSFEDEIRVPDDAKSEWDVETQSWIRSGSDELQKRLERAQAKLEAANKALAEAGEEGKAVAQADVAAAESAVEKAQEDADRGYRTAKCKSVIYYEKELTENKWHDGTNMSVADFVMAMIMQYELSDEKSPLYDEFVAASLISGRPYEKGWKIVSEKPLVIEFYSDNVFLDAEQNVYTFWPGFPLYPRAQGSWYQMAISNKLVADGAATYSKGIANKEGNEGMEWLNWVAGPSLELLEAAAKDYMAEGTIPFEPELSKYVSVEQAKASYKNLLDFYNKYGHFYSGMGPYILTDVLSVEETVVLKHNPDYRDDAEKWSFLSSPKLATVELDGPGSVSSDAEATFEVMVSFGEDLEAYPANEISSVKYLLFDSKGAVADVQEVEASEDGLYPIKLTADSIKKLGKGSCKIEVVVSPISVAAPSIIQAEFVVD